MFTCISYRVMIRRAIARLMNIFLQVCGFPLKKIRLPHDLYNGNPYTDKTTSLKWDVPWLYDSI